MKNNTDWKRLLAERKARLERLLALDSPDIIIYHAMEMVKVAQDRAYPRGWRRRSLRSLIVKWWKKW